MNEASTLEIQIRNLDEKLRLLMSEAEKRNEQRFEAQREAVSASMSASEKAVTKAEVAAEKRFESVNEFRKTLSDQTASFITRAEYNAQYQALNEKVESTNNRLSAVDKSISEIKERGLGQKDTTSTFFSIGAILIALASVAIMFFRHA